MSELGKYIDNNDPIFQKIKMLNGRSMGITGWKVKQENNLLYAIETTKDDDDIVIDHCIKMVRTCVDKPEVYDTLPRNVLLHLIAQIRKMSKGGEVEITYHCSNHECQTFQPFPPHLVQELGIPGRGSIPLDGIIDLDKDVEIKEFDNTPIETTDFIFHIYEIPFTQQRKLEKKYLSDDKNFQATKFNHEMLLRSIYKVEIKGKETIEDFELNELSLLIDQLPPAQYKKMVSDLSQRFSVFEINKMVGCPTCHDTRNVSYNNIFSLLVF